MSSYLAAVISTYSKGIKVKIYHMSRKKGMSSIALLHTTAVMIQQHLMYKKGKITAKNIQKCRT